MQMKRTLAVLSLVVLAACADDDTTGPTTAEVITKSNVHADSAAGWVYYSIDGDSIVPTSESATTKWDIRMAYLPGAATKQIDVFLNSGTAGSGVVKGAMIASRFENLTTVPAESTLKTDDTTNAGRVVPPNVIGSNIMFVYDITTHTIAPSPDKVLVIKTGKGTMVKFQFTSIYKDAVTNPDIFTPMGYYHFRYSKTTTTTW
ncbi:MAG: hypothetical protein EHM43_02385 [Ignavibacteriae bacterium]|nr:MAG: hypothetical protein EHM43_02385 [Ignavibacteriota bacterium]